MRALRGGLRSRGQNMFAVQVHWAPHADAYQSQFLSAIEKKGSKGNMSQELVVGTLADALMYTTSPVLRAAIYRDLDIQLEVLNNKATFFAHSLGGLIVTDYLRQRPHIKDVRLVTLGCNIGLFFLGRKFDPVPQLLAPGKWLNLYSKRDMLGFPLNLGDPNLAHVVDVPVSLGGWFTGWTGLAHTRYWDDDDLWEETLPELLG